MRAQLFFAAVLSSRLVPAASQSLPSLHDALVAAGASNFAALIQASANASELYSSGAIKTVFAPSDEATGSTSLTRRAEEESEAQLAYQACRQETTLQQTSAGANGGSTLSMGLRTSGLKDTTQKTVVDSRPVNTTTVSKRQVQDSGALYRRSSNATSLLRIEAGLGVVSNVIKGDVAYDGGLIQITDSYFTLPVSLSSTADQTGQTTFNSLANSSNVTSTLENSQSITVFLPSNAAFAAAGNSSTSTSTLISNHAVADFVGYLPALTDGLTLTTKTGDTLTVSIRSGIWYINNAAITQANLVLENGVAHVIDKVLVPTPTPVVTASGHPVAGSELSALLCVPLALLALLF